MLRSVGKVLLSQRVEYNTSREFSNLKFKKVKINLEFIRDNHGQTFLSNLYTRIDRIGGSSTKLTNGFPSVGRCLLACPIACTYNIFVGTRECRGILGKGLLRGSKQLALIQTLRDIIDGKHAEGHSFALATNPLCQHRVRDIMNGHTRSLYRGDRERVDERESRLNTATLTKYFVEIGRVSDKTGVCNDAHF